jgi:hypothetical protein
MSSNNTTTKKDAAAIIAGASRHKAPAVNANNYSQHPARQMWCDTQWANLSIQAKKLELPELPYFDPETMLLSKDVNDKLWTQLVCVLSLLPVPVLFSLLDSPAHNVAKCNAT